MVGVSAVVSGYSGGHTQNPTYEDVVTGTTGHIEVVEVEYDANIVSYDDLLDMFFKIHDPTTIDRQGPDVGEQYKSVIFYANIEELNLAKEKIDKLDTGGFFKDPIVTELRKAVTFYKAEEYHHNYFEKNPLNGYCNMVVRPKVEKFRTENG